MAKLTYDEGEGDGSTYGMGHNTTTLYITNEDTGEERAYAGWTYMDVDYWDEDLEEQDVSDEDMQMDCEELQEILTAIWEQDEDMGYGAEDMPFTVTKEAK